MFDKKNTSLALELITFSHTLFVLPLIFTGYFISIEKFDLIIFLLILVCAVSARTIGMLLNRLIDAEIDSKNPRTAERPVPAKKVTKRFVLFFLAISLATFLLCSWLICDLVFILAPIPIILFFVYPYLKRWTYMCHFFLGVTLSIGPLAGGIAATCSLQSINETLPIAIFTIFWISGFDILYALQDFKHDVKSGIYSVPSYFGKKKAIILSSFCFVTASSSIFYYLHSNNSHGSTYILLILLVLGFFIQILRCNRMDFSFFKYNSYIGFLILILIFSDILLR